MLFGNTNGQRVKNKQNNNMAHYADNTYRIVVTDFNGETLCDYADDFFDNEEDALADADKWLNEVDGVEEVKIYKNGELYKTMEK